MTGLATRVRAARAAWLALLLAASCTSPGVAGGTVVAPGTEPHGTVLGRWTLAACRNSLGEAYPEPDLEVRLVRPERGALVLVEEHEGYDTLVVTNASRVGDESVFQLALKRGSQGPTLREYRVPSDTTRAGRFAIVRDVRTWNDGEPKGAFTAKYTEPALACVLQPAAADAGQ